MSTHQPTAHLICGFIGAGKTTFARKLELETGAVRITKDEWLVKIFGNAITADANFAMYDQHVSELSTEFAFKILEAGADVIIDDGFWSREQRDEMRKKLTAMGFKPLLYYVASSVEQMRERTVARSKTPPQDSFEISGEMFDSYMQFWEPPEADEEYIPAM